MTSALIVSVVGSRHHPRRDGGFFPFADFVFLFAGFAAPLAGFAFPVAATFFTGAFFAAAFLAGALPVETRFAPEAVVFFAARARFTAAAAVPLLTK